MAVRIIFKAHYLSGEKSQHIENYLQYMGTRPGVEIFDDDGSPATEKQKQLIEQLLEDFGKEMTDTFEYEDYLAKPTKANASAAITACVDTQYSNTATKENFIDYIANRPRVEKLGEHGLFAQTDAPLDLDEIAHEVAHQGNNVWTDIISLRREDAIATGFDNATAWRDLLRGKVETIARNYKIPLRDFVWYAAFHDEGHHPHVHFVCYSKGNEGFLTEKGIENIKSSLAHEIFKQEFSEIYGRQTQLRTNIKDESTKLMEQMARNITDGLHENTELTESVITLAERLDGLSGKKQYGYLPKDVKALVDAVVGELAQHEAIATLYDLWYEQKEQIAGMYKDDLPDRVSLSENKEFTSVKNMIIREADALSLSEEIEIGNIDLGLKALPSDETIFGGDSTPVSEISIDDICLFDELDLDIEFPDMEKDMLRANGVITDNEDKDIVDDVGAVLEDIEVFTPTKGKWVPNSQKSDFNSRKKLYWRGKQLLQEGNITEAIECFTMSAEQGNTYAQYRLGRLYLAGTEVEKDIESAIHWLSKAVEQNNEYAQYTLGTLYLSGEEVPIDSEKGEMLLRQSAEQGNPYAMYRYGCLLRDVYDAKESSLQWIQKAATHSHPGALYTLCSQDMPGNFPKALTYLNRLEKLDRTENSYIAYYLGKLYLMDENRLKDVQRALSYLQEAAEQENDMALYTLGKLYLADKDIPKNIPFAVSCLEQAAKLENSYAEYQLGQLYIRGIDVPQDVGRGLWYLNSAAEKDNDMAWYALGKLHLTGENGVEQNVGKALDCFHRSADLDNAAACCQLGKIYLDGIFVQKDVGTALAYLEKSASLDNDAAMYALGNIYLKGEESVPKDIATAVQYFKTAADRGNDYAMYQLGKLYFLGEDLPQDVKLGIWYMEQAIAKGNDTAMCFLGRAYLIGDNVSKDIRRGLELLREAANCGNEYAEKMIQNFNVNAAHAAISILHKLSLILQNNTSALVAKKPVMPAVDKKEWIEIMRKKSEHGILKI